MSRDLELYESALCHYFDGGKCCSCPLLYTAPGSRLTTKLAHLAATLQRYNVIPTVMREAVTPASPWGTRHKVKMSVSGSLTAPVIGITRRDKSTEDLIECALATDSIRDLLRHLPETISSHSLVPYDIATGTGELKFFIVMTTTNHQEGIVRFVLKSAHYVPRVRAAAAALTKIFPWIKVISCNIQPVPAAILEGPEEILLSDHTLIRDEFGDLPLYFAPQSFMQVTPTIAQQLYARASYLVAQTSPGKLLDLFCGVGGFTLSAAPYCSDALGIEISEQAISCARRSASEAGLPHVRFEASDVEEFLHKNPALSPDLVIANPPRRGLSEAVINYLKSSKPGAILYSSCNPETFARNAQALSSLYTLEELTPFDMFPLTNHWEVLGYFSRTNRGIE